MNALGSDHNPDHVPTPEALAAGQRTLAAIVFTDTVGFSKLMRGNEELALRLVGRDLELMRTICEGFGGQVLKSTGDGLLMLFTSAVQAVACALEIQRDLQKRNADLPRSERLQHRIGIHLGDVFQHGGDVMGDGVNIAARLQTEAVPGGICLSNTVYEVVHNRLQFYVNDLGARKLKNIGTVTAYQISPAKDGPEALHFRMAWYRWRPWVWLATGLLGLLVVMGMVYELGRQHQRELSAARLQARLKAAQPVLAPVTPSPAPVHVSKESEPESEPVENGDMEFEAVRFEHMQKYDFEGMEDWIRTHDWPGKPTETLGATCHQLDQLFDWSYAQLQKYSPTEPLVLMSSGKAYAFWPTTFGGLKMRKDGEVSILTRDRIPPRTMVGIIRELIKKQTRPGEPLRKQLNEELQLFMETYHVTAPVAPKPPNGGTGSN